MVFNKSEESWNQLGAYWTSKEIFQQPETWLKTLQQVKDEQNEIRAFIDKVMSHEDYDIILTGAGTSEFVGNSIYSYLNKSTNYKTKSYASTDIVACPENFLSASKPTLLVSFGRSGNSPESVAAVEAANTVCETIYHLFVTCNHEGALAKFAEGKDHCYAINLTPETHDQSFAMTSSFSNMYLATILAFNLDKLDQLEEEIKEIAAQTALYHQKGYESIAEKIVSEFDFSRIVYLGSNCLKGVAQESALKMCELTRGEIMTTYDSCMGFRHGPKSVRDGGTLTGVYLRDDPYTRQYDSDIVKEIAREKTGKIVAISGYQDDEIAGVVDYFYSFDNLNKHDSVLLGLECINVAQTIALVKSMSRGVKPDTPSITGTVTRVVHGVTIYPYNKK